MRGDGDGVTVLMPVYNAVPYLAEAIDSILQQTHGAFEFIIIDDGSTDDSPQVIDRYAAQDSRIHAVRTSHLGVAAALTHGLALARGSIVVRMDADDVSRPTRLERQVAYLSAHPEIAVVGGALQMVNATGAPRSIARYPLMPTEVEDGLLQAQSTLAHPAVAFRRAIVQAVGGYRAAFNHAEDYDLWLRISEHYPMANLPDVLLDFRCHDNSVSQRRRREQALAGHIARLAAHERRAGRPDPTTAIERLCLSDLDRFDLSPPERASIFLDLSEAALVSYEATRERRYLADAEESLAAQRDDGSKRAGDLRRRLAGYLWRTGERRRSLSCLSQMARPHVTKLTRATRVLATTPARRAIADWLVHCADPLGPRGAPPRRPLSPAEAAELVEQAAAHSVLASVLEHFPPFEGDPTYAAAKTDAQSRHRLAVSYSLMLRHHADLMTEAMGDLPAVIVKGPVFAKLLYPKPSLRPFTDIDFLAHPSAVPRIAKVLAQHGFRLAAQSPEQWTWLSRSNEALMIEVQTDLVHAPGLRRALTLTYDDIADAATAAAGLLLVACVHGAMGAHFDKLRYAVDICQAARLITNPDDERQFEQLVAQTGTRLAAKTGLALAARLFDEPRCREIATALGPQHHAGLARRLITPTVVTSSTTPARALHSWRRSAFRALLKRGKTLARHAMAPSNQAAMTACLVIVFNHAYPANIEKLRRIYGRRFSNIVFLLPNVRVPNDLDCFTGYRGSYCFHGLIADARDFLRARNADVYVFAADDLLLDPALDEHTIVDALHLREHDGFVSSFEFLAGKRRRNDDDPSTLFDPGESWMWTARIASRLNSRHWLFGSGVEGYLKELPDRDTAIARFEHYGTPSLQLDCSNADAPGLTTHHELPFPMAYGVSDLFAVRRDRFERFAHYLGVFASLDLFVEAAVPTALILATDRTVTARDIGRDFCWATGPGQPLAAVAEIDRWFPAAQLFVHPVKLSTVSQ